MKLSDEHRERAKGEKPLYNANKRYVVILEENAKKQMATYSPDMVDNSHRMGRLYESGVDGQVVECGVRRVQSQQNIASRRMAMHSLASQEISPTKRDYTSSPSSFLELTSSAKHSTRDKFQMERNSHSMHRFDASYHDDFSATGGKRGGTQPMKTSSALGSIDKQRGGVFFVHDLQYEPYQAPLLAKPQQSSFTKSTPNMWDLNKPSRREDKLCSKSGAHSLANSFADKSEMSSLQQVLLDCGRLKCVDESNYEQKVFGSLRADIQQTKKHASWLKHKNASNSMNSNMNSSTRSIVQSKNSTPKSRGGSKCSKSILISRRGLKKINEVDRMAKDDDQDYFSLKNVKGSHLDESTASLDKYESGSVLTYDQRTQVSKTKGYWDEMATHLGMRLVQKSGNPHRARFRHDDDLKYSSHQSLQALRQKVVDHKKYSRPSYNMNYGTYNVSVKEPVLKALPTKECISSSMSQVSKHATISYKTRIVETGALLRALQDQRHPSPGLAAILDLNRAFIVAASFNPSTWTISRIQFEQVLQEQVSWYEKKSALRLASAFDTRKSGMIKFSRLSAALVAGNRPAMSVLMSNLSKDRDKVDSSGNSFLLRLLHSVYEDCDGGVVEEIVSTLEKSPNKCMEMAKPNSHTGLGIKLEDIPEILSACATNAEEEMYIRDISMEIVQVLYEHDKSRAKSLEDLESKYLFLRIATEETQECASSAVSKTDRDCHKRLFATKILKYPELKHISSTSRVSQNDFVKSVIHHPEVLKEFDRQVNRFRELLTPYQVNGSISYEDSVSLNEPYGI